MKNANLVSKILSASMILQLAACSDQAQDARADLDPDQPAQPRAVAPGGATMGYVRWNDQDLSVAEVTCRLDSGWIWGVRGRGDGFRFSVELVDQLDRTEANLDFNKPRLVRFWVEREGEEQLAFAISDNHELMGEIEGSAAGFVGRTPMFAGNAVTRSVYPLGQGIDVEFELNCP